MRPVPGFTAGFGLGFAVPVPVPVLALGLPLVAGLSLPVDELAM